MPDWWALIMQGRMAFRKYSTPIVRLQATNGSAFAGLNANTLFYNLTLGIGMLIGRFGVIIPVMAIAGSMAKKKNHTIICGYFFAPTIGCLSVC